MPTIDEYLQIMSTTRYGKEMRPAIVGAVTGLRDVAQNAESKAITAQDSATASATIATEAKEIAVQSAEEAKKYRDEAFHTTPSGYEALVGDVDNLKERGTTTEVNSVASVIDVTTDNRLASIRKIGGLSKKSANLFDANNSSPNKALAWASGVLFNEEKSVASDFIPIKSADNIYMNYEAQVIFYKSDKTFYGIYGDTGFKKCTCPTDSNIAYVRLGFRTSFNGNADMTTKNIMVSKGELLPYEPYFEGLQSNPIEEFVSEGANLWDEEWEVGWLDYNNGTTTTATTQIRSKDFIDVKPNTTYFMVCSGTDNIRLFGYDKDGNFVGSLKYNGSWSKDAIESLSPNNNTFITNSNIYKLKFFLTSSYGTQYKNDIAIIKGASGTYKPYMTDSYTIPTESLQQLVDLGYGLGINEEVYNYIEWLSDGRKLLHKRVIERILNGSENWRRNSYSGNMLFALELSDATPYSSDVGNSNMLVDDLTLWTNTIEGIPNNALGVYGYSANHEGVFIRFDSITDIASWKTYLENNPLTVQYELATEQIFDVTDLLQSSKMIEIEKGGTITLIDSEGNPKAVPSTIEMLGTADANVELNKMVEKTISPRILTKAVYDENGKRLDNILNEISKESADGTRFVDSTQVIINFEDEGATLKEEDTYLRGQIKTIKQNLAGLVKTKTMSITTGSNGEASMGISSTAKILSVRGVDNQIFIPYVLGEGWNVIATQVVGFPSPSTNITTTITVDYIE